ncbi:phage portal protein [Flavobacteriaceae bacterium]|nr:phage portal protein [Flavobacteriaceae bacterium]
MNDLRIVNLSTYTTPDIVEKSNKDWVSYGADNNYFKYLIDRYNGSPTNNAIINGMSEMIYGRGLDALNSNKKPDQYASMISLLHKDMVRKLCYDLKLMGQCSMQVIYSKDRKSIAQVEHIPVENLRAEKCNDKGEIEGYFYSDDWTKVKNVDQTTRIPAFGSSKENIEIIYVKPYRAGYKYYSSPDYAGGLQYAELEQEISNYHLNNILNGLAPSMLINFNNGTPNSEERQALENRIYQKFSGSSNAGKFILAFNDNPESAATIEPIQLSEAHQQYQFLSDESSKKVMVSHRVVSPMLLGIKDNSGLGNNAEELKTASTLMDNTVIRPFQMLLIDAFDSILAYNQMSLKLYFKTLQPLEFTDLENVEDAETKEEETGVKLSEDLPDELGSNIADELIDLGQTEDELLAEYDLVDESEVDYELNDELDEVITDLNTEPEQEQSLLSKAWSFVSTGTAKPNEKSKQDGTSKQDSQKGVEFLVRYSYAPEKSGKDSRQFCSKMVSAKKVYRKEDIVAMGNKSVNPGFGKGGSNSYSIWLWKGGARCNHKWFRKTYQIKNGKKSEITSGQAKSKGFKAPKNAQKVPVAPKDMKYKGYTAEYWNKMKFKN